jgi:hypothetical protein
MDSALWGPKKLWNTPEHSSFRDLLVLIQWIQSAPQVLQSALGALPSIITNALTLQKPKLLGSAQEWYRVSPKLVQPLLYGVPGGQGALQTPQDLGPEL